jgi:hypothetical protein
VWSYIWDMTTETLKGKIREYDGFEEQLNGDQDVLRWSRRRQRRRLGDRTEESDE